MKNLDLFLKKNFNSKIPIFVAKNSIHFCDNESEFNSFTLHRIINFICSVREKYRSKIPIYFEFSSLSLEIKDKLAFVIFECICYSLRNEGRLVYVFWHPKNQIITAGVNSSPLLLLNNSGIENNKKFLEKFESDLYLNHYRKLIQFDKIKNDIFFESKLLTNIENFLKNFGVSSRRAKKVSQIISELVGNVGEHTDGDCLLDIDITDDHSKVIDGAETDKDYYGINIVVLNFCKILLGESVKTKIAGLQDNIQNRYRELANIYETHLSFVKEPQENRLIKYDEEYFWNIAALQDKISGRNDSSSSGGTGLTVLIRGLQHEADNAQCYVMSGKKIILFGEKYIDYNEENDWLGFNLARDFVYKPPDDEVLTNSDVYIPGTAYNLCFVMEREENIDGSKIEY